MMAILFAGRVTLKNKFKNKFIITQAPQEIAGFFVRWDALNVLSYKATNGRLTLNKQQKK